MKVPDLVVRHGGERNRVVKSNLSLYNGSYQFLVEYSRVTVITITLLQHSQTSQADADAVAANGLSPMP